MTAHLETEFKLRTGRDLEAATVDAIVRQTTFTCASATSRQHQDIYLDDSHRSLAQRGMGLRVRVARDGSTIACKGPSQRAGALFVREEYEERWPRPTTPATAADLPERLRDVVEPLLLRRRLVPILRLEVARDLRHLGLDGNDVCELAIDRVEAHGRGTSARFSEIEIEVVGDVSSCEKLAQQLEHALTLEAATSDKPTHAATLLGMIGPAGWNPSTEVTADTSTTTALTWILERHIGATQQAEVGVRQRHNAKPIRRMRTASRRTRSFLESFRTLWTDDEAHWMNAHLRALGAELGRIRDLDVVVRSLGAITPELAPELQPSAARIAEWLRAQRATCRSDLLEWLRSPQRLDDSQRFALLATGLATESGEPAFAIAARDRIADEVSRVRRRFEHLDVESPIADFHRARIAIKRLRHLIEGVGEFAAIVAPKTAARLRLLQRALGRLGDADTATRLLLSWASRLATDFPADPLMGPTLGAIAQTRFTSIAEIRSEAIVQIRRERKRLRVRDDDSGRRP